MRDLLNSLKNSNVLVTGGCGFIGSHLIPELVNKYDVIGLSHSKTPKLNITQIKKDR